MSELEQLAAEISVCRKCILSKSRTNAVPGEGPAEAEILFVGEGPGFHENEQGRPFVGAAGKFLEELLATIGMRREQVFICNVVKCRPPGNRDPLPEEIEACAAYLERQLQAVNPRLVVTLGRFSMGRYFPGAKISEVHGKPRQAEGRLIVPMYHPAAALHQPSLKRVLEEDFKRVPQILKEIAAVQEEPAEKRAPPPQQLSMF
jgi:DNA polymerase